jgi:hypothetical protein
MLTSLQLLRKANQEPDLATGSINELDADDFFIDIRCPLCKWRPSASSRWCCERRGTPEAAFAACGTIWNTFATRGLCPGCGHQWLWTTCLRCQKASLHEAWYEGER